ncbi:MAG: DAK2 domain-containing protein, partial [Oscillospiraceae bacterium]|nr:DAK2 domain-containing protein [Oscillospiraceae bacterium]
TEGTILTVSRLAADAAVAAAETEGDVEAVLSRALEAGYVALADTINQNPVLKKAGVIDSGGKGYLYILDGMLRALRGEVIEGGAGDTEGRERANFTDFDTGDITFAYCTEFIVSRENPRDPNALRAFLDARGDSIVLVDDDEIIKVHVHTNEPGDVITEALTYGALLSVKIENMREQHTAQLAAERPGEPDKRYGMAAVCSGPGLADVFRDLGADQIITGGQTMNPSTDDILAKVEAVRAEIVFVFPNNKNIIMAAEQCVPLSTKKVVVIPSKSVPQGVSAMLAFDETLTEDENSANMRAPLTKVRTLQVTRAARDSVFDGHSIREGEHLALLEDSLLTSGTDFAAVAAIVAEKLKEIAPDFITVFTGEDARADDTATLSALFARHIPNAEATVVEGGQPVYEYIISAE